MTPHTTRNEQKQLRAKRLAFLAARLDYLAAIRAAEHAIYRKDLPLMLRKQA